MEYLYLIAVGTVFIIIILIVYRSIQSTQRAEHNVTHSKEVSDLTRQNKELQAKVFNLNELITRYLSFMMEVPTIVQRLNTEVTTTKIVSSITRLVDDVIKTDKVELYTYGADSSLRRMFADGDKQRKQTSYAFGEGLIGMVAKNQMSMTRAHLERISSLESGYRSSTMRHSLAVPIIYKERLLGVIGIGEIMRPTGNESQLIKMIADIAGVALFNQRRLSETQHKANTDPLTGLNNRNYFVQMTQYYVEKALKEDTPISIFLFDIDNFKNYNDTNGHASGDNLLKALSRLIFEVTRKDSTIARYGGEEFIVMLPGVTKEGAFVYAERLREKTSLHPFPHGEKQPLGFLSISGGVASFPEDGKSMQDVIQHADEALYQAKAKGKNLVLAYEPQVF